MVVSVSKRGAVAVVQIDNPPVNAIGHEVREGLLRALDSTEQDAEISAVVMHCAGRTFIAGADVREFDKPPMPPHLPDILDRIEGATKPWVAAIHGTALGGGLETALACAYRVAASSAKMGLPEVTLGVIPGAGGTVRLPRVVAAEVALQMIVTGKPVTANAALSSGLVDRVTDADLLEAAVGFATEIAALPLPKPVSQRTPNRPHDPLGFEQLSNKLIQKGRGQSALNVADEAVHAALTLPPGEAFENERARFLSLRASPEAAAMRHVFFSERATSQIQRLDGIAPHDLTTIGVIGGGTMGAGIAAACLLAGLSVTMIERDADASAAGGARVHGILDGSLKRRLISSDVHTAHLNNFVTSEDYATLHNADLVIEAVFEDLAVKREVFANLDKVVRPDCVLATNTSYLDVTELAAGTAHPSRVLGLHFFSPAHIMKLLEVVVPDAVDDRALATGVALAKCLKKIPVLAGVCDGFIANRIMSKYRREADYMLEDGAMPWDVDDAMEAFGFPMGIFRMQDLAGLDISWAMRKRQAARRDPLERYVDIGDVLCTQGQFGRKSGKGYYLYDKDDRHAPSPSVEALIISERARKGITPKELAPEEIMARILGVMQAEGQRVLDEGIAQSAEDIDVVMVNAFGFPRWKGGPMYMSCQSVGRPSGGN